MFHLKKTALLVAALGSSVGYAGTMGPVCVPGNVTVPCPATAWDVGIQALYLRPAYSANTVYAGFRVDGERQVRNEFSSDWGWGFKLEGSYHFNTGNDFNVNWYHYSKTTSNNFVTFNPLLNAHVAFTSSAKPKWDAVNFELGQHVNFGEFKDIRFHGGFQYLRLSHDIRTRLQLTGATFRTTADFKGFGPRIGTDLAYNLGNGFSVYANGAAALLVGDSKSDGSLLLTGGILTSSSKWSVVPELEAKTGAKYNYNMVNGVLTLDAGYMVVNYFNAQHATTALADETNVAFTGPYAGIKWVGNV